MKDVLEFIRKAHEIYGYINFINDAGGSVCELDDENVINVLSEHTLILYIQASQKDEEELIRWAEQYPKPLFYREAFLDEHLSVYMQEKNLFYVVMIDSVDLVCWMFLCLFYSCILCYEAIV